MPEPALVDLGDMVRVVNLEQYDLFWSWDSRRTIIKSGDSAFVLFDCAKVYVGDPRSGERVRSMKNEQGLVQFIPDRATETRRLKILYNDNRMADEAVINGYPDVEVYTMTGERITTVLDDPVGRTVIPVETTKYDSDALMARIDRQDRLIAKLLGERNIQPDDPSLTERLSMPVVDELPPEDV